MSLTLSKITAIGLFFLFIFLSGFWLSRSGRPINAVILTIHKLISLAALVFLAVNIYRLNQTAALNTAELAASIITGVLFLSNITTGGLLSLEKPMPPFVLTLHQITSALTLLSTAVTLYLL